MVEVRLLAGIGRTGRLSVEVVLRRIVRGIDRLSVVDAVRRGSAGLIRLEEIVSLRGVPLAGRILEAVLRDDNRGLVHGFHQRGIDFFAERRVDGAWEKGNKIAAGRVQARYLWRQRSFIPHRHRQRRRDRPVDDADGTERQLAVDALEEPGSLSRRLVKDDHSGVDAPCEI